MELKERDIDAYPEAMAAEDRHVDTLFADLEKVNESNRDLLDANLFNKAEETEVDTVSHEKNKEEESFRQQIAQTKSCRYEQDRHFLASQDIHFSIASDYDFLRSTEENYAVANDGSSTAVDAVFVGKYQDYRRKLDYSYHKHYEASRQLLQDDIIDRFLHHVRVFDVENQIYCESPLENWIVFTAGTMGAGKGHTMKWLSQQALFPIEGFVQVDPDEIRRFLPETAEYNRIDDNQTGFLTQKEVGYISEILTIDALEKHRNVLVDGSLRNANWYLQYFQDLRTSYPIIKIAIISVEANLQTVLERAKQRALITGRVVPEDLIVNSLKEIAHSMEILVPQTDFYARMLNEDLSDPDLLYCELHDHHPKASSVAGTAMKKTEKLQWTLQKKEKEEDKYVLEVVKSKVGSSTEIEEREVEGEEDVLDWKSHFEAVWVMRCAMPSRRNPSTRAAKVEESKESSTEGAAEDSQEKQQKVVVTTVVNNKSSRVESNKHHHWSCLPLCSFFCFTSRPSMSGYATIDPEPSSV